MLTTLIVVRLRRARGTSPKLIRAPAAGSISNRLLILYRVIYLGITNRPTQHQALRKILSNLSSKYLNVSKPKSSKATLAYLS